MNRSQASSTPSHPRYPILRRLGTGGSGSVYLARDLLDDGRKVALKVGRAGIAPADFQGEFRILRELRHPGIPRAFDFGRLRGGSVPYFTLEYVDGPDLEKESARLRKGPQPDGIRRLMEISLQVVSALGYLHRKQLLHHDLKPANVVFCGRQAKLIDFGIFERFRRQGPRIPKGTAFFTAPEVFDGGPVDARTDLYSLGVTLYRSFTGRFPISGRTLAEVAEKHRRITPPPPPGIPEAIGRIISKLLSKSPDQRFQDAREVASALREIEPLPAASFPSTDFDEPDFVGRRKELAELFAWLEGVRRGEPPRLLVIEGTAGGGKSRFLEACITELLVTGARVIPLLGFGGEDRLRLRSLFERIILLDPPTRTEVGRFRFLLTALGIESDPSIRREMVELSLDQIRSRVFHEALELLAGRVSPSLFFVIDDLHLASPDLLDFLGRLGREPRPSDGPLPLGIIAAHRPDAALARWLPRPGEPGALRLRLGPLGSRDLHEALRGIEGLGRADAARIARTSRGNPGSLVRCIRGLLTPAQGDAAPRSPPGWRRSLRELGEGPRRLALYLGLLERPVPEAFLLTLSRFSGPAFHEAKARLEGVGLVRAQHGGLQLSLELAGDWLRAEVDGEDIRAAHEDIGLCLLREGRQGREAARHLLQGGRIDEGLRLAEDAARDLERDGRVEDALALLDEALPHAEGTARLRMLEASGGLREKLGEFVQAAECYRTVLEGAGLPPSPPCSANHPLARPPSGRPEGAAADRLRVLRKLGGVEQRRGENEKARGLFEEALQLLESVEEIEEHLELFNELSALYLFRGEFSKAGTFANRGLELLSTEAAGSLDAGARAYHCLNLHSAAGHILLRQFEYDGARKEFLHGLRFAEEIGSLSNTALILNNLGIAYHQANRLGSALKVYRRAAAIARRMGDGTAQFSILCNVAGIRARLGEIRASEEILEEVGAMPHAERSKRARLFLLHTRGLLEKLSLKDARGTWEESVRIAEELPDPLFARYGRMHLFENEIHQGRWGSARALALDLEGLRGEDSRLDQAVAARRAWLEALTGRSEASRALLPGVHFRGPRNCADLWDSVYQAAALIELGDSDAARTLLVGAKKVFDRSRQLPGSLDCTLHLADLELRRRNSEAASLHLKEARRLLALHDMSTGSRGARVRIPYLEARLALQTRRSPRSHTSERIVDATANLGEGCLAEVAWLTQIVSEVHGDPGARRKLTSCKRRFVAALAPADRKTYLARDHRRRLGLGEEPEALSSSSAQAQDVTSARRYEALISLRQVKDPRAALELITRAARAARGAIFLDGDPPVAAVYKIKGGKRAIGCLRLAALRVGSGPLGSGVCGEIEAPGKPRTGVLYLEPSDPGGDPGLAAFVEIVRRILANRGIEKRLPGARTLDGGTFDGEDLKTRTLGTTSFTSESPRMREVLTLVQRTRDSRLPVLIMGESGAGKDHLARWIHSQSPRAKGPFVAQDCSAIPSGLLEAEIFGFEEGAFTGAERARTGYLFNADGGTFYIDNVDSMAVDLQVKLLRVLQEHAARPLGSRKEEKVDARFIASTQRDLREMCARGEFRKDLYFRLAGISLHLPPLRERAEDILILVEHFQRRVPGKAPSLTPAATDALKAHSWPGNVRELESVVRRLALVSDGVVDEADVGRILGLNGASPSFPRWVFEGRSYDQLIEDVKREYLLHLFEKYGGDLDRIALALGTTKRNVYLRFSQAGIRPVDLRQS